MWIYWDDILNALWDKTNKNNWFKFTFVISASLWCCSNHEFTLNSHYVLISCNLQAYLDQRLVKVWYSSQVFIKQGRGISSSKRRKQGPDPVGVLSTLDLGKDICSQADVESSKPVANKKQKTIINGLHSEKTRTSQSNDHSTKSSGSIPGTYYSFSNISKRFWIKQAWACELLSNIICSLYGIPKKGIPRPHLDIKSSLLMVF